MFHFLTLAVRVLLNPHNITDKESCRTFLLRLVSLVQSYAKESKTPLDDAILNAIEFILNNTSLFDYVHRVVFEQLQTEEILFESADEEMIAQLTENAAPESVDLVLIVSLITRIIDLINGIKRR